MIRCDFAPDAHPIVGTVHSIAHDEVKRHARAYAKMQCDLVGIVAPGPVRDEFLRLTTGFAEGRADFPGGLHHCQSDDWACCDACLALWRAYCGKPHDPVTDGPMHILNKRPRPKGV